MDAPETPPEVLKYVAAREAEDGPTPTLVLAEDNEGVRWYCDKVRGTWTYRRGEEVGQQEPPEVEGAEQRDEVAAEFDAMEKAIEEATVEEAVQSVAEAFVEKAVVQPLVDAVVEGQTFEELRTEAHRAMGRIGHDEALLPLDRDADGSLRVPEKLDIDFGLTKSGERLLRADRTHYPSQIIGTEEIRVDFEYEISDHVFDAVGYRSPYQPGDVVEIQGQRVEVTHVENMAIYPPNYPTYGQRRHRVRCTGRVVEGN